MERRKLYESLSHRGQFDALTGLYKRASLYDGLSAALIDARSGQTVLAVFYIDLNGFKKSTTRLVMIPVI